MLEMFATIVVLACIQVTMICLPAKFLVARMYLRNHYSVFCGYRPVPGLFKTICRLILHTIQKLLKQVMVGVVRLVHRPVYCNIILIPQIKLILFAEKQPFLCPMIIMPMLTRLLGDGVLIPHYLIILKFIPQAQVEIPPIIIVVTLVSTIVLTQRNM